MNIYSFLIFFAAFSASQSNTNEIQQNNMNHNHAILKALLPNFTGVPIDFVLAGSIGKPSESGSSQKNPKQNPENEADNTDCPSDNSESKSYKIVGGNEVESSTKYPWMAKVWISAGSACSASIISANKILTARHCVTNNGTTVSTSAVSVSVGSVGFIDDSKKFGIQSIIIPPQDSQADFAILVLDESLPKCNPNIKPICMYDTPTENMTPGSIVTAMGWGFTKSNGRGPQSSLLKEAKITIFADCGHSDEYFCGKYNDGVTCYGDSGGPVVTLKEGKYTQIGVNAWIAGDECGAGIRMGFSSTTTHTFIDLAKPFTTC